MRSYGKRSIVFGVALLLAAVRAQAVLPDWMVQAKNQSLPTYPPDTDGVVLLDDTTYVVTSPSEYVEHYRKVVKILRPEGREAGEFFVHFRGHEKVLSQHAWSVDKDGREYEVKDKDFVERGVAGYELYDDVKFRTARVPAANPGSVIAFEYEMRRQPMINQLDDWLQADMPMHEARLALELPAGWEYKTSWAGISAVEPVHVSSTRTEWTVRDLPGIQHEAMRPPAGALAARVNVTYFGPGVMQQANATWDGIGRWYDGLIQGRRDPSPDIAAKAQALTAGQSDFDGKIRALASFLQTDVRYVAIEIGIGGFQPHSAGDVFRARYGDCKDKATLLSSLLQTVGIRSDYVIIHTERGEVRPELPSTYFNHAILAIELPDGAPTSSYHSMLTAKTGKRYLIFDPTDTYTPVGELRGELQDTYALLVTDTGGELIHTPLAPPEQNLYTRSGHFTLSADGILSGDVVVKSSGDHAVRERSMLANKNEQERTQSLERSLNQSLSGFRLDKLDIQQLSSLQQNLVIAMSLTAPGYSQARGPLLLLRPRVFGEKGFYLDRKPRRYPFQFESTTREVDDYDIELPKEYAIDDIPDPVNVDVGFASYQSKVSVTGSKIHYRREFIRKDVLIPADHTDDVRKLLGVIGADETAVVILKRTP
jgi:Domain of Unknown Function with PDB structure (DUF3857)/Transglutaminase-like superfamily